MSNKNNYRPKPYHQYSKPAQEETAVAPVVTEEVVETVVTEEPEVTVTKPVPKIANYKVTECEKLNIRKGPNTNFNVVGVVNKGDILIADLDWSDDNWLSVITEDGLKGFCMAKFVTLER